jgi:pyruvate formate lyase activating enzyme
MNAPILSNPEPSASAKTSAAPPDLTLGGITPFTSIDFPGRLAAVLYTQGCAWSCRYCHNAHLQPFRAPAAISFAQAVDFLKGRRGLLEGVVFCGGEPTAHEKLPEAMRWVRGMGFQTALHTTGMYPERLERALPFCDWVGMDVKAPFGAYAAITQRPDSGLEPRKSLSMLLASGVSYEIRTTVHPALLSEQAVLEIALDLAAMGVSNYVLQTFRAEGCSDPALKNSFAAQPVSRQLENRLASLFPSFSIRG